MRIVRRTILIVLSFSVATTFVTLCYLSPTIYQDHLKISSSNVFIHLLFNSLIIVIVAKEHYGNSRNDLDKSFLLHFANETEEKDESLSINDDEDIGYVDDLEAGEQGKCDDYGNPHYDEDYDDDDYDSSDDDYCHGSDGYDEDDDDNGSDGEIGWEEDEQDYDSELERRIEAFIAKVVNGWKEELFSDNMQN